MMANRLSADECGVTAVEFGLIAPVLCMMVMGLFDMSYNMYTNTMLQGTIREAARQSTIEGAAPSAVDAHVAQAVRYVAPHAELSFKRKAYTTFSTVARAEDFNDSNADGVCSDGETFEDSNGNGSWDRDPGSAGNGGARDAVLYRVDVSYVRMFPIAAFIGLPENHQTSAVSVLRNQPFSAGSQPVEATCM